MRTKDQKTMMLLKDIQECANLMNILKIKMTVDGIEIKDAKLKSKLNRIIKKCKQLKK